MTARILFVLLFLLVSIACREQTSKDSKSNLAPINFDLEQIQARGKLVALTSYSSISYFIYRGKPMGYEYELLTRLAKSLEVELEIIVVKDLEEMFRQLNLGIGDIIATNLTVTQERQKLVKFTEPLMLSRQVLVQRRPDNWEALSIREVNKQLIRNPIDLIGKEVYVRNNSSYASRLKHLNEEIGGTIIIKEPGRKTETELLIKQVSEGVIDYTVADENIARMNQTYYDNLDIKTPLSFSQRIGWAVRTNAPDLLEAVNVWLEEMKDTPDFYVIYNKYYKNSKTLSKLVNSQYSSGSGGEISVYDPIIKAHAEKIAWDWRLLASLVYQESRFQSDAVSWAGAMGLMQLMPSTAERYSIEDPLDPNQNIRGGVRFLKALIKIWDPLVPDSAERIKFILASYNCGPGHVLDAYRLADKYGKNKVLWDDHVAEYLLLKSESEYYNDPVVKQGYCRGAEAVNYVTEIIKRHEQYKQFIPSSQAKI